MKNLRLILPILMTLLIAVSSFSQQQFGGKVTGVLDGKTLVIQTENGWITVEMPFIEVPEPEQPLHTTVRNHLEKLVVGKYVEFKPQGFSPGKTVGHVYLGEVDIAQQMVRDGAAWHIEDELSGQNTLELAAYKYNQEQARKEKLGVWSIDNLKPAWQFRAEKIEDAKLRKQTVAANPISIWQTSSSASRPAPPQANRKSSISANSNPKLGNVGALVNEYNPKTKNGYLSTSFIGLDEINKDLAAQAKLAIAVTYFYHEDDRKGRNGVFVFTLISASKKLQFLTNNDLWLLKDGKSINLGKPRRTTSKDDFYVRENLSYTVSKGTIDKIVNTDGATLRIGNQMIYLTGFRYLLYNMLQIAG